MCKKKKKCDRSQVQKTFRLACGVFCEEQDGPNVKSYGHSLGTEKVWFLCACGNAALVHQNEQTSTCIPPKCICKVFHLEKETQKWGFKTQTHQLNTRQIYPPPLTNSSNYFTLIQKASEQLWAAEFSAPGTMLLKLTDQKIVSCHNLFLLSLCSSLCHISTCFVLPSPGVKV